VFYWYECPQGMAFREQTGGQLDTADRHGHVLVEIARNPGARIRDIAATAGLSQRTVQAIIADLEAAGLPDPHPVRPVHRLHHPPVGMRSQRLLDHDHAAPHNQTGSRRPFFDAIG